MKHIYRLLALALVLFAAAACYNQEIEGPQDPDQQQSDFRITASIVKTRVSYTDRDAGYLDLDWDDDDVLYGFINCTDPITFKVSGATDGVATLVAASDSDEDALLLLAEDDIVDLVYIGNQIPSYDESGNIIVNMTGQDPSGKIPACMSARAIVVETDGSKSLDFHFVNDCAIFEVESLTGMAGGTLSTISITNLFPKGKYTLSDEGFTFAGNGTIGTYTYNCGEPWGVETGGVVTYDGYLHPLLIAVAPNPEANAITVGAKVFNGGEPMTISYNYGAKSIAGGTCYVISAQPYVAMTVDGMCHKSVKEAFDRAEELYDYNLLGGKPNIVTLIKDHIDGLGEHPEPDEDRDASLMVEIDYAVTLDLNGCTLSLIDAEVDGDDTSECFYVDAYSEEEGTGEGNLTIKDSRGGGIIESNSDCHVIVNEGNVTIESGKIKHISETGGWCAVSNYGELNVKDGELYSCSWNTIYNEGGKLTIDGGKVFSSFGYAVDNESDLSVNGGEVYTDGETYAIFSNSNSGARITIGNENNNTGPSIHNDSYSFPAIYINGTSSDDVTFTMNRGLVYGSSGVLYLQGTVKCYIKGGEIASGYYEWTGDQSSSYSAITLRDGVSLCEISGGKILSGKYGQSSVTCEGSDVTLRIIWNGTNRSEPFLYSHSNVGEYIPPINVTGARCTINIEGGWIYEGSTYAQEHEVFLNSTASTSTLTFSDFYSNKVGYRASTRMKPASYYTLSYTSEGIMPISASEINIDGVITIDETELNFYHIEPPADPSPAPAGTSSYFFDSFDW